jgi:hypothetical protein
VNYVNQEVVNLNGEKKSYAYIKKMNRHEVAYQFNMQYLKVLYELVFCSSRKKKTVKKSDS